MVCKEELRVIAHLQECVMIVEDTLGYFLRAVLGFYELPLGQVEMSIKLRHLHADKGGISVSFAPDCIAKIDAEAYQPGPPHWSRESFGTICDTRVRD